MAHGSAEALAQAGGHGNGHAGSSGHENSSGSAHSTGQTFRRELFLKIGGTGREINTERKGKRGQAKEGIRPKEISFSDELKTEYSNFLRTHLTNLAELRKEDRAAYERVTQNRRIDKKLMSLLADRDPHLPDNVSEFLTNDQKIDRFLEKPEGWIIATQLMEEQTAMKMYALGLHAANLPAGQRERMADAYTVNLGIDQGRLNKFMREKIEPNRMRIMLAGLGVEVTAAGGLVGLLTGGPLGAAMGASLPPALYGMYRAVENMGRNGMQLDLRQCSAAFQNINSNPAEREYVQRVMGIDTRDLIDRGGNLIEPRPGRIAETSSSVHKLQDEVLEGIYARQRFYESLGVPRKRLDALPEQFLYAVTNAQQEQTGARWQDEVRRVFDANGGGYVPRDFQGNLTRFMDARRQVMERHIDRYMRQELSSKHHEKNTLARVQDIRKAYAEGGAVRTRREREINEARTRLEGDNTILEGRRTELTQYQEKLRELQNARAKLSSDFPGITTSNIAAEIADRLDQLGNRARAGSYAERLAALETQRDSDLTAALGGITLTGAARRAEEESRQKTVQDRFEARKAQLDEELGNDLRQQVAQLRELRKTIQDAQRELGERETTTTRLNGQINNMQRAYADVTGWGISDADLRTQTTEQLLEAINRGHAADVAAGVTPPRGWPEGQNGRERQRTQLYNAIIEANARNAEPTLVTPGPDFATVTGGAYNVSENQLRTLTNDEIRALPGCVGLGDGQLNNARNEANRRIEARISAFNDRVQEVGEQIQDQNDLAARIAYPDQEGLLRVTENLMTRKSQIVDEIYELVNEPEEFTDTRQMSSLSAEEQQEYTTEERNHPGYALGYFEMLNFLFDYKNSSDIPRGEYFNMIHAVLPPQVLAERLNDSLGLGVTPPAIGNVLQAVRNRIEGVGPGSRIDEEELRPAFRNISEWLGRRALAVAA